MTKKRGRNIAQDRLAPTPVVILKSINEYLKLQLEIASKFLENIKAWILHDCLLALWPVASHSTSLHFSVLICAMGAILVLLYEAKSANMYNT